MTVRELFARLMYSNVVMTYCPMKLDNLAWKAFGAWEGRFTRHGRKWRTDRIKSRRETEAYVAELDAAVASGIELDPDTAFMREYLRESLYPTAIGFTMDPRDYPPF